MSDRAHDGGPGGDRPAGKTQEPSRTRHPDQSTRRRGRHEPARLTAAFRPWMNTFGLGAASGACTWRCRMPARPPPAGATSAGLRRGLPRSCDAGEQDGDRGAVRDGGDGFAGGGGLPGCGPAGAVADRIWDSVRLAAAVFEECAVGVPADPGDPVSWRGQHVQHLGRLRAGCVVAGEHDSVRSAHLCFVEHCLEGGQDSVNVRQDGYSLQHGHYIGMTPARRQVRLSPQPYGMSQWVAGGAGARREASPPARKSVEPHSRAPLPFSRPQSPCQGRAVVHQVRPPER